VNLHGRTNVCALTLGLLLAGTASAANAVTADELSCIGASARYNGLPPALLLAVRQQEGGRTGFWRRNADGSFDYGVMQINSRWLPVLQPLGYTASALTYDACASIAAGAWMLAQALAAARSWNQANPDPDAYWRAVGDYHSRTPALNRGYAERVWARYRRNVPGKVP
jgi:soluble lytic murein transglycosylase-like protein